MDVLGDLGLLGWLYMVVGVSGRSRVDRDDGNLICGGSIGGVYGL